MAELSGVTQDNQGRLVYQGKIYVLDASAVPESAEEDIGLEEEDAGIQEEDSGAAAAAAEAAAAKAKRDADEKKAAAAKKAEADKAAAAKLELPKGALKAGSPNSPSPVGSPGASSPAPADLKSMEQAWLELTQDKHPTNWVLFGFPDGKTLGYVDSGSNGLEGLVPALDSEKILFAGLRVDAVDQQENVTSTRPKFISLHFVGDKVKGTQKVKGLQSKDKVMSIMKGSQLSWQIASAADVTKLSIAKQLLASGGAHKPTHYDFGNGDMIAIQELYQNN